MCQVGGVDPSERYAACTRNRGRLTNAYYLQNNVDLCGDAFHVERCRARECGGAKNGYKRHAHPVSEPKRRKAMYVNMAVQPVMLGNMRTNRRMVTTRKMTR